MPKKLPFIAHTEERLLEYAAWYFGRYAPSVSRLRRKLLLKSERAEWVDSAISRLSEHISDQKNLESRIRTDIENGVGGRKIRSKYRLKGFEGDLIESVLQSFEEDVSDWESHKSVLIRKMQSLQYRGKSRTEVSMALSLEYREFKEQIACLLETEYPSDADILHAYHKEGDEGTLDSGLRKKRFDRLMRKGFSYDSVKRFLNAEEE